MRRIYLILFFLTAGVSSYSQDNLQLSSWKETQENKKGDILLYWFTSQPFIYENEKGKLSGIEYEIFQAFKDYLKEKHGISLTIHYHMSNSFIDTFYDTRDDNRSGAFGVSSFSITDERKKEMNFVSPYMPDISVMISSGDVPVIEDAKDFPKVFSGMTAVTIKGSTYESDLIRVQKEWNVDFDLHYINSNHNILKTISDMKNAFGFVDLPIYLVQLQKNPSVNVKRQNLLPIKRDGYSFVLPKKSDWTTPMNEFIESNEFKTVMENITAHYFDKDLYQFIEDFYVNVNENVVLLNKEKEMQYEDLIEKDKMIVRETLMRNFLMIAIFMILFFLFIIFILYRRRIKNINILRLQAEKITLQSKDIKKQKEQLENRNSELTTLNEEKNNLIKVLAHDLRSPIHQIQGFLNIVLLESGNLSQDQMNYLDQIKEISNRANKMIGKILDVDALESNRVNIIYEDIDLEKLLEHIILTFSYDANNKDIQIKFAVDKKGGNYTIKLDRLYMTQIMENLISNSLKFSNNHTVIKIELHKTNNKVLISVNDQGQGFTEEDKKRLFKKFQQLSARPTSGEKSTGLGLSIVKKYVDLMNGNIWVESEENNGARFFIEFPVK